jgi:hypothetical protein
MVEDQPAAMVKDRPVAIARVVIKMNSYSAIRHPR